MILELSPGRFDVLDRDDLKRLKMRVPSGWDRGDIQNGLPFEVAVAPDYIWLPVARLRELLDLKPGESGSDALDGMLDIARRYGFYDDVSASVRVHLEYY